MTYSVILFRDRYYITAGAGDKKLDRDIGPWRSEKDARKKADDLNASTWISGAPGRNAKQGTQDVRGPHDTGS